ncbi:hypothetical protein CHS0354_037866 [Potamilus streckersoni]|uniref:Uncharacterized protein n=1 Tax=Potamilus streckersoni TaxID=2493646 RepID=A0AAE0TAB3_9BIVA|nr:hypothetical protein CHS0354_037866 [Potamilus streckersoni]
MVQLIQRSYTNFTCSVGLCDLCFEVKAEGLYSLEVYAQSIKSYESKVDTKLKGTKDGALAILEKKEKVKETWIYQRSVVERNMHAGNRTETRLSGYENCTRQ